MARIATAPASAAKRPPRAPRKQADAAPAVAVGGDHGIPASQWPASRTEWREPASLAAHARNARTHSPEQISEIVGSIKEFGFTVPVLVDEKGIIIAGHGRVLAAERLGLAKVPVIVAAGWSETQKRAYMLADNKLPMNAGWDRDLLRTELTFLRASDVDLGLLGFNDVELVTFMAGPPSEKDPDEAAPEPEPNPVSKIGDLWCLGRHRLLCGDSTVADDVTIALDGTKPNIMVTDPPYGVDYDPSWRDGVDLNLGKRLGQKGSGRSIGKVENDDRADWTDAWKLFPGSIVYVWHGGLHAAEVQQSLQAAGFEVRSQIIWVKQHFVFSRGDYHWQHEPCWYAVRGKGNWTGDRKQTTVWEIPNNNPLGGGGEEKLGHGTQKPVECMRRPMMNNTKAGDFVYEPFAGSGTTIIAAELMNLSCRAIELSPAYVDVCVKRWQTYSSAAATLSGDGRTFAAIEADRAGKGTGKSRKR